MTKPKALKNAAAPKGKPRGRSGGRKPDAATRRSKDIANLIAEGKRYILDGGQPLPDDATPLDVMLAAMRSAYDRAGPEAAAVFAKEAAPYLHARIAQMELKNPKGEALRLSFTWADEPAATDGI
jgi:hypothetical protein